MARFSGPAGGAGGDANIADFIFTNEDEDLSSITLPINKEMTIETSRDDDGDADINIRAADDVFINANGDEIRLSAFGAVEISTGDGNNTWTFGNGGGLDFPNGGNIYNPSNSSGDGLNAATLQINPSAYLESDQYIVLDPTAPNHIHIRAGGDIDESNADLILGGEKNNVVVSDSARDVFINTRPNMVINSYTNLNEVPGINFIANTGADIGLGYTVNVDGTEHLVDSITPIDEGTFAVTATGASFTAGQSYTFFYNPEYTNSWQFGSDGTLYGPAMGMLKVSSIYGQNDFPISILGPESVILDGDAGEFLNDASNPENQIATIGDINNTVTSGMVRYSPIFTATGLTFTGSGETYPTYNSYYAKAGNMVSFVIEVDCSTVTNFGTGQYKLQLPFPPAIGYNHFTGWANVDPAVNPDVTNGHVILNVDHAGLTDVLDLHYLKQAGGAHTPIIEGLFLQGTPVTLTTSSKIYVNGTYIAEMLP